VTGIEDPNGLNGVVDADRMQGLIPVMVAAVAGTTNARMIDPPSMPISYLRRRWAAGCSLLGTRPSIATDRSIASECVHWRKRWLRDMPRERRPDA